jgi:hypothetical protein
MKFKLLTFLTIAVLVRYSAVIDAGWISNITGIDINVRAGTVSIGQRNPAAISVGVVAVATKWGVFPAFRVGHIGSRRADERCLRSTDGERQRFDANRRHRDGVIAYNARSRKW